MSDASFASTTPSRYLYVSTTGSNAGDGSAAQPYATIQYAVNHATPGTAILVQAGTYVENVKLPATGGTTSAPIWLISADGPQAAIIVAASNDVSTIKGLGTDNYVIKDFLVSGGLNGIQFSQSGNAFTNMVSNIVVDGNVVVGTKEDGIKISQADNVTISNNTISKVGQEGVDFVAVNNSSITHNEVSQVYGTSAGIFAKGGSTGVQITNNFVHDVVADGIVAGGWTSFDYDGTGRLLYWRPNYTGYEAKDVVISGNVVENVSKRALDVLGGQNVDASNNFLQANPLYDFAVAVANGSPNAPTPMVSSNVSIHDNLITTARSQFYAADGSTGVSFTNNTTATLAAAASFLLSAGPVSAATQVSAAAMAIARAATTVGVVVTGRSGNDSLLGTDGNDTFQGGTGFDTLTGGKGDDTYEIRDARDSIVEQAGEGFDDAQVYTSSYVLPTNVEVLVVDATTGGTYGGNAGDNLILGSSAAETLVGGGGSDTLVGGGGADTFVLKRGDGNDTVEDFGASDVLQLSGYDFTSFADVQAAMMQSGSDVVITLGQGETLTLDDTTRGALTAAQFDLGDSTMGAGIKSAVIGTNRIYGGATSQVLTGTDSNDYIAGRGAGDILVGGLGDDLYFINATADRIVETANAGIDSACVYTSSYTLDANVENAVVKGTIATLITGNALDNEITGGAANDTLSGGAGNDQLIAGAGTDLLYGGTGNDKLISANTTAGLLDGGAGRDTAVIDRSKLISPFALDASNPNRLATASDGTQVVGIEDFSITGSSAGDALITGAGDDTLAGGAGNDRLMPGDGANVVDGGVGDDTLVLAGTASDWTVGYKNKLYTLTSLTGHGTTQATNIEHVMFGSTRYDLTPSASVGYLSGRRAVTAGADMNGDGTADVMWMNNGRVSVSTMNGTTTLGGGTVSTIGLDWAVVGHGDLNGDGRSDLVLRNATTGEIDTWLMNGTSILPGSGYLQKLDTQWTVAGVGDFDGDGKSDLVLRNSATGEIDTWLMNGNAVRYANSGFTGKPGTAWQVAGTGDFNGDGRSDLLLRNSITGELDTWNMNGAKIQDAGIINNPGAAWQVAGTGDFNGDGKTDITLQNSSTGAVVNYLMNNRTLVSGSAQVTNHGTDWKVVGTGDYNGDGLADIAFNNVKTNELDFAFLNGSTQIGGGYVSTTAMDAHFV